MNLETNLFLTSPEGPPSASKSFAPFSPAPHEARQKTELDGSMQQLIDDLPEQIALLDEECTILAVNNAWRETVEQHGFLEATPGGNYLEFCRRSAAEGYEPAVEAASALEDICSGQRSFWQLVYNGRDRWDGRDFQISFHRINDGPRPLISVTRFDLTELLELRRVKEDYTTSLIESQAIERQRMARELHDSTSQLLTAAGLLLGRLRSQSRNQKALDLVEELQGLVMDTQQEIRAISYLAHPPALEKLGLAGALRSLVGGFARRTALEASFEIQGEAVQLSEATESAMYRAAQEALSNAHRHARASRLRVILCFRSAATHVVVADNGIGIPKDVLADVGRSGVGLESMRGRLVDIGGRLIVHRLSPGTALIATVRKSRPFIGSACLP